MSAHIVSIYKIGWCHLRVCTCVHRGTFTDGSRHLAVYESLQHIEARNSFGCEDAMWERGDLDSWPKDPLGYETPKLALTVYGRENIEIETRRGVIKETFAELSKA